MALPLVLVIMLFGTMIVGTAVYLIENLHSTTEHTISHARLYNSAQTGVERAKDSLWKNRESLWNDVLVFNGDIVSIYARKEDGTLLSPISFTEDPGIDVTVLILDCNYELGIGQSYGSLLPPRFPGGSGEGSGSLSALPGGTSAIIDPGRFLPFGGGAGEHRYVIRSTASKEEKNFKVEVMVVVTP